MTYPLVSQLGESASHPTVVWTVIATACLTVIILAAARLAGPLSEMFEQRRKYKQRIEDARIVDLSNQVDHLAGRIYTLEGREVRRDRYLVEHAQWDHELMMAAIAAGLDVSPPPPLRPPLDAP
jgi:hypothetical protein